MQAIVNELYGSPDVLQLREVDRPQVTDTGVLVRVLATPITSGDMHLLAGTIFAIRLYWGIFKPRRKILGWTASGVVEAVGDRVTDLQVGDEVVGEPANGGAWAEYVVIPADRVVAKPAALSHAEAASIPVGALTALQGLRDKGGIQRGHSVLINGASGGVGMFAVQLAQHFGATVTATCSAAKQDYVRSLGADEVIDYRASDFTECDERYDLVLDLVGDRPVAACKRTLTPTGTYVCLAGAPMRTLRVALFGGKRMVAMVAKPNREDLAFLMGLIESGDMRTVIDREFPFRELPGAMRYYLAGEAQGKVVVTL